MWPLFKLICLEALSPADVIFSWGVGPDWECGSAWKVAALLILCVVVREVSSAPHRHTHPLDRIRTYSQCPFIYSEDAYRSARLGSVLSAQLNLWFNSPAWIVFKIIKKTNGIHRMKTQQKLYRIKNIYIYKHNKKTLKSYRYDKLNNNIKINGPI